MHYLLHTFVHKLLEIFGTYFDYIYGRFERFEKIFPKMGELRIFLREQVPGYKNISPYT